MRTKQTKSQLKQSRMSLTSQTLFKTITAKTLMCETRKILVLLAFKKQQLLMKILTASSRSYS